MPDRHPSPLRVLFVDHETRLSGGERNLVDLVVALPAGEVDCHAAVPGEGPLADALRAAGATVHLVPFDATTLKVSRRRVARNPLYGLHHALRLLRTTYALWRLLGRVRPHLVHSTSQKAHLVAGPAARARRIPHVWHMQDILEPGWLLTAVRLVAAATAARIICLSEAAAAPLRTRLLQQRIRVVYPGVTQDAVPDQHARSGDRPTVGIVAQLAWWKGQDVFVDAAALVSEALPDSRFVIAGTCLFPENEAAYVRRLEEQVQRLGLDGRLRWLGHVEPIAPLMASLDVAVHASRQPEPFGRVIVEALAQGTPVVTTDIGAGPELVPPDAGRMVPPDDAPALAAAILELVDRDPADRAATAASARRAAARFTPAAGAAATIAVWRELRRR